MPPFRLDPSDIADLAQPVGLQVAGGDAISDPVFEYLIGVAIVVYQNSGPVGG